MKTLLAGVAGLALGLGAAAFVPPIQSMISMMSGHEAMMGDMDHSAMPMGDNAPMNHDQMGHGSGGMMMQEVPEGATEATKAFIAANGAMHTDMAIEFTGNADVDFVKGMIPHHQGAVDMAKIVLQYGTDPEIKTFAQGIIDAQESEIAFMRGWLAKNGQ